MQSGDHSLPDMRSLLEAAGTPFTMARYPRRAVLFFQGDASDSVRYIEKGRVWLAVTTPGGKEAIFGLLTAGAFLGEELLGGQVVRGHTAIAMTATEVLVIAKAHASRLLHGEPALADRLIAHILRRHTRLEADLTDQLLSSAEQRLAHTLLALAGCNEHCACRCALPDVSQEIIAKMVGTTRSRVNAFMGKFKKSGFIEEDDGVLHVNVSPLRTRFGSGVPVETSSVRVAC